MVDTVGSLWAQLDVNEEINSGEGDECREGCCGFLFGSGTQTLPDTSRHFCCFVSLHEHFFFVCENDLTFLANTNEVLNA